MGCVNGLMIVIECKKPERKSAKGTSLQKKQLGDWAKAGAIAFYAVGEQGYRSALEGVRHLSMATMALNKGGKIASPPPPKPVGVPESA